MPALDELVKSPGEHPANDAQFVIAVTLGEMRGRVSAVEQRLERSEAASVRIEAKIDLIDQKLSQRDGTMQIGAWIADAARMLVAAVLAPVVSYVLMHGRV